MITAVSKDSAVWRRELRGAVLTVIEFPPVPERAAVSNCSRSARAVSDR